MDDSALLKRVFEGIRASLRLCAGSVPQTQLIELDGVLAAVNPALPDRSLFNAVSHDRAVDLESAYETLAGRFETAGVRAWTVYVHESDREAAELLEDRGHLLDASPAAMACELGNLAAPDDRVEVIRDPDLEVLYEIHDRAYEGDWLGVSQAGFGDLPDTTSRYLAELDGEPAAFVLSHDQGDDCCVMLVATVPEARGRGLAKALMAAAMHDGQERGCRTTSLWATEMGTPLYLGLGYRDLGAAQMWERRKPATG